MKVTVLGTSGAFPAAGGATSGYLLEIDGHYLLIDCGSGVLGKLFQIIRLDQIEAIILTHLHFDHMSDLHVLKYAVDLTRKFGQDLKSIPVFAPATPEPYADSLQSEGNLVIGRITDGSELNFWGAKIRCIAMEHPVETYALSVEHKGKKLAYTADSVPCANLQSLLQDADIAIMDAGSLERFRKPVMVHMTAFECATLARVCNVRRLLLTHLLPFYDPQEVLIEAGNACEAAELAKSMTTYEP
jgi:ribonuclease BN (tRNA processing enzyme)